MGKRSPILGYNHNVRYRGLVFHVQTEDSGVLAPHLFTHLFHGGVIVSTRKLVYDAGSAEDSIKSLMQAQHKATLKDLRRGHFDDKIDSYLGGTPGLLPRGTEDPGADKLEPVEPLPSTGMIEDLALGAATEQVLPVMMPELSEPVMITEKHRPPSLPPIPPRVPTERALLVGRGTPPSVDTTLRTEIPVFADAQAAASDATQAVAAAMHDDVPEIDPGDSLSPEIEIQLELDDNDEAVSRSGRFALPAGATLPRRATRDTELQPPFDQTRPTLEMPLDDHTRPTLGMVNEEARRATSISDGIPGAIRAPSPAIPPPPPDSRKLGDPSRTPTANVNASALPPARPILRPPSKPALSQPQVMSRPVTSDDRHRRESEAIEVYSPALPSAELPSQAASAGASGAMPAAGERPGQYAQHKRSSQRIPVEGLKNERSGGVAIPAGLGRPHRSTTGQPASTSSTPARPASSPGQSPGLAPGTPASQSPGASSTGIPVSASAGAHSEPVRGRAPTPPRVAPPSHGVPRAATPSGGSGVVMSRPAVIVGAPSKSVAAATVPRIRKAREDEGRGFGQGLISEKSLDEVILAYLSEDADEK